MRLLRAPAVPGHRRIYVEVGHRAHRRGGPLEGLRVVTRTERFKRFGGFEGGEEWLGCWERDVD
jgi:hypothetical protein